MNKNMTLTIDASTYIHSLIIQHLMVSSKKIINDANVIRPCPKISTDITDKQHLHLVGEFHRNVKKLGWTTETSIDQNSKGNND